MIKLKCAAIEPLLKLSGRFQLIMTQVGGTVLSLYKLCELLGSSNMVDSVSDR